jgi:hypothetical protein
MIANFPGFNKSFLASLGLFISLDHLGKWNKEIYGTLEGFKKIL